MTTRDPNFEHDRALAVPSFFDGAEAMRGAFEARVGPSRELDRSRFVWDYWHVPGQYTYLRTAPRNVFPAGIFGKFMAALKGWSRENLGCTRVAEPWLSYYIAGCRQEFHTDVIQGAFAYVLSLTRWEGRGFRGGETLLMRSSALNYWTHYDPDRPAETDAFVRRIPPRFNHLLIFDARVPHGVARVEGTHDPLDSRVVLHGWVAPAELTVEGALRPSQVAPLVESARTQWQAGLPASGALTGVLVMRASVEPSGEVSSVAVASKTLLSRTGNRVTEALAESLARDRLLSLRLPAAEDATTLTVSFTPAGR